MKKRFLTFAIIFFEIAAGNCFGDTGAGANPDFAGKAYAERYYRTASTIHAPLYGPLAEFIVSRYNLADRSGFGIDIGGGPGHLAVELAQRTTDMHWVNADINPYFFPYTRSIADEAGVGHLISTLLADAQDFPLKENTADIVVSRGSFHLWKDKLRAFSEIYRVLKPGGVAFIGRGFSENLPVDVAARIRAEKREKGSVVSYDPRATAAELEKVMKTLGINEYTISIPQPPGSEGILYGIWLEFRKSGRHPTTTLE